MPWYYWLITINSIVDLWVFPKPSVPSTSYTISPYDFEGIFFPEILQSYSQPSIYKFRVEKTNKKTKNLMQLLHVFNSCPFILATLFYFIFCLVTQKENFLLESRNISLYIHTQACKIFPWNLKNPNSKLSLYVSIGETYGILGN